MSELLVVIEDLTVTYDSGAVGVDSVSLSVPAGSIVAILGRNGAGKTSLLRGIAGFLRADNVSISGRIAIAGTQIAGQTPMRAYKHGVVFVPERDKIFPSLRVAENLRLAESRTDGGETSLFPGFEEALGPRRNVRAGMLSGGERQMLALAMAGRKRPKLLLVDELSLGLAPVIARRLMASLRSMAEQTGVSVILVEQEAAAALKIADYVYVMDRGRIVWRGRSDQTSATSLAERYLSGGG